MLQLHSVFCLFLVVLRLVAVSLVVKCIFYVHHFGSQKTQLTSSLKVLEIVCEFFVTTAPWNLFIVNVTQARLHPYKNWFSRLFTAPCQWCICHQCLLSTDSSLCWPPIGISFANVAFSWVIPSTPLNQCDFRFGLFFRFSFRFRFAKYFLVLVSF